MNPPTHNPLPRQLIIPAPRAQTARKPDRGIKQPALLLLVLLAGVTILSYFNVDRALTAEDRYYIRLYLPNVAPNVAASLTYNEQVALIERAQLAVFTRTTGWLGIAEGQPREPKELFLSRSGMCYDRSRVLEKIFTYLGFTSRHLSMFTREEGTPALITILFHHVPSHAVSEVLTKKGWLMVDSNTLWVSLDAKNAPVSVPELQNRASFIKWHSPIITKDPQVYSGQFIFVYGLYSRHGLFYAPYIPGIPDYNIRNLFYNVEQFVE